MLWLWTRGRCGWKIPLIQAHLWSAGKGKSRVHMSDTWEWIGLRQSMGNRVRNSLRSRNGSIRNVVRRINAGGQTSPASKQHHIQVQGRDQQVCFGGEPMSSAWGSRSLRHAYGTLPLQVRSGHAQHRKERVQLRPDKTVKLGDELDWTLQL